MIPNPDDPHADLSARTQNHRKSHGCSAYPFADGAGLFRLVNQLKPRNILELGGALGYTACTMASAAPAAKIVSVEGDLQHISFAQTEVTARGLAERIEFRQGFFELALLAMPAQSFDLAFFDGYDPYPALITSVSRVLEPKATLVCSNIQLADDLKALISSLHAEGFEETGQRLEGGRTKVFQR